MFNLNFHSPPQKQIAQDIGCGNLATEAIQNQTSYTTILKPYQKTALKMQNCIAPNPSSGAFTLDLGQYYAEPILVEIRDLAGRSVHSLEFQEGQRFEVDLSGQPTGLYFFEAVSEGERIGTLKAMVK